ncbi:hypothetical protein M1843_11975 [Isoptericola sp. 4D.3]|uniref:Uncharacterized protein n=1 Tax=Isoptericola peretonis TaxID=2918523 RepID=A0ABT0J4N7_9MICO|nr:hypothetical protein [Isoptericola sp. 4D.3]
MTTRTLARTWLACLAGCLPLLVLLLVPQLMRSRAGSEQLLILGTGLLLVLLTVAFVLAPVMAAWSAPVGRSWEPRTALRATALVWRLRKRAATTALVAAIAVYAAGQVVGYWIGAAVPYVSDNPEHLIDPDQPLWVIHYPAYLLQAVVLYLATTLAVAVYGWRIRALSLQPAAATTTAPTD